MKNFADITKPLHSLTEKNAPFEWTVTCELAFDNLRKCLTTSPVLAYPEYSKRFVLDTDASDRGIVAILTMISQNV